MRIIIQIIISSLITLQGISGQNIRLVVHGTSDIVHKLEIKGTTSDNHKTIYLGNHTSTVDLEVNRMDLFKMTTFDNFGNLINTEEVWLDGAEVDMRPVTSAAVKWKFEGSPVNKAVTDYQKRVSNRDFQDLNKLYEYFYSLVADHRYDMVASLFIKPVMGLFGSDMDKLYAISQLIADQPTDVKESIFMKDIHARFKSLKPTSPKAVASYKSAANTSTTVSASTTSTSRASKSSIKNTQQVLKKESPNITIDPNRFSVVNRDGRVDRVVVDTDSASEVVIMDFWFTQCRPCAKDHKQMLEDKKEGGLLENVDIVGISVDKRISDWQYYLQKHDMPWTNYKEDLSSENVYSRKIGIWTYPNYLVLDKTGRVLAQVNSYYKVKEVLATL